MAVADAVTARGMAQRIKRAIPAIQQNFIDQNALLYLCQKNGRIKWSGFHTDFEWYVRRTTGTTPSWGGGELGIRTFEEVNPANRAHLPYCWLERTYGVSDRSIETNRHAGGAQKVFDILKENLTIAQIKIYDAIVPSMWDGGATGEGDSGEEPIGLDKVVGEAYQETHDSDVDAGRSYANLTLNTSAIGNYSAKKAGYDDIHWAPTTINIQEVPSTTDGSAAWATDCLKCLAFMAEDMAVTQNVSGTGRPIKPDTAFMRPTEYHPVVALLLASQHGAAGIPLGRKDVTLANFPNIVVDTLTCIKDSNVPLDKNSVPRVFVLDSKEYFVCTTHTKAEGLIINEFSTDDPLVSGAIGVLKANLGYMVSSPAAVGCLVGVD